MVLVKNKHRALGNEEKAQLRNKSNIEPFGPNALLCSRSEMGWRGGGIHGFWAQRISQDPPFLEPTEQYFQKMGEKCSMVK